MKSTSENVEMFYLDDMEDEVIITEMTFRRQKLKLDVRFFLDEADMLSALAQRRETSTALPGLIVTDLNMPGRGGVRLVESLRSETYYQHAAIGVCTGSENPADHAAALAAGADFVVVKPLDRASLLRICKETGRFQLVRHDDGKDRLCPTETPPQAA